MAAAQGVGLIAMKPLAGGRLAQISSRTWETSFFKGESPAQIALRYVLSNPHIHCAIPGMMALDELEENVRVGKSRRELSPEEIRRFMEKAGDAGKGFCRNCGYCLPCPEGVPIPDIFRYESYSLHYGLDGWAQAQYAALSTNAQACSECQQCLDRCPYAVSIPSGLKNAHKILKGAINPFYA
jgi:predicted aldo/keto reductase-like oxidoreductase